MFVEIAGWSILDELAKPESDSRIQRTEYAQPANFLLQVGLVAELAALGVEPAAIVGHSVGEVSAAYVSGALALRDALLVSYHRGASAGHVQTAPGGCWRSVCRKASVALRLSEGGGLDVVVAAVNSPDSLTLAGPLDCDRAPAP